MSSTVLHCGRYTLALNRPLIMGILNITPDSFSDGGRFHSLDQALKHAEDMVAQGADILDIGGESTRPGAPYVSPEEEIARVLPVLERLKDLGVPLSLDTRRSAVMQAALALGAVDLINDVSALEDEGALALLASAHCAICLMHKQGNPDTMQAQPHYQNVVTEVADYLAGRLQLCFAAGIPRERLLIDPGFGFGKTLEHNLALLKGLAQLQQHTQIPVLVGLSRKSMLGQLCHEAIPEQRLGASIAVALEAARRGAKVIRVHDVKASRQAMQVWAALQDEV